jgi:hypothetical protein
VSRDSLTGAATFSFKQFLNYPHEAEWTPFQTHYFSENLVVPGIEPGTSVSVARNSDHWTKEAVKGLIPTLKKSLGPTPSTTDELTL